MQSALEHARSGVFDLLNTSDMRRPQRETLRDVLLYLDHAVRLERERALRCARAD
jgi:hypothetical protein